MDHRDTAFDPFEKYGWYDAKHMIGYLDSDSEDAIEKYRSEDDEHPSYVVPIHCHMEVCPDCDGRGTYVNPNIDRHGISPDEFYEDPDFAESYFAGHYDIICANCHGSNVVPVPDEDDPNKKYYDELLQSHYEYCAEREAEMRMCYGPNY